MNEVKGFKAKINPSNKYKYGYGMHQDFVKNIKQHNANLLDLGEATDPDLIDIKKSLRLDLERQLE